MPVLCKYMFKRKFHNRSIQIQVASFWMKGTHKLTHNDAECLFHRYKQQEQQQPQQNEYKNWREANSHSVVRQTQYLPFCVV